MRFEEARIYIVDRLEKELPAHLFYHNTDHINDVYEAAERIGKAEKIAGREMTLLLTAALFHDSGFISGPRNHEEMSCEIARTTLPRFDYTGTDLDQICGMIMATKIPQTPGTHLEMILADADLDYLGRDDFFVTGERLYRELCYFGTLQNEQEWNMLQLRFLESHQYFTHTAIESRKPKKLQHMEQIKDKINSYRFS